MAIQSQQARLGLHAMALFSLQGSHTFLEIIFHAYSLPFQY